MSYEINESKIRYDRKDTRIGEKEFTLTSLKCNHIQSFFKKTYYARTYQTFRRKYLDTLPKG